MSTRATITSVKREARRVFGDKTGCYVRDCDGIGWECVSLEPVKGVTLRVWAGTKTGVLADAFDLLSTLQRKEAP